MWIKRPFVSRGFTLVELLVVLAVIGVLSALMLGVAARAQARGRAVECLGNLRQLGAAALLYAGDNGLSLPGASHNAGKSWTVVLRSYAGGNLTFRCPADEHPTRTYSYAINDFLTANPAGAPQLDHSSLLSIAAPSRTLLFGEAAAGYTGSNHFHFSDYAGASLPPAVYEAQVGVRRHSGAAHYLFADGHVEALRWAHARARLADASDPLIDPTRR